MEGGVPHSQVGAAGGPSQPGRILCGHREAAQALPGSCASEGHEVLVIAPLHSLRALVLSLSQKVTTQHTCFVPRIWFPVPLAGAVALAVGDQAQGGVPCTALTSCLCMASSQHECGAQAGAGSCEPRQTCSAAWCALGLRCTMHQTTKLHAVHVSMSA